LWCIFELTLGPGISILLWWAKHKPTSQTLLILETCMLFREGQSDSVRLKVGISWHKTKACIESSVITACAPPFSPDRLAYTPTRLEWMWDRVAETTNSGESNDSNLRLVLPILFLKSLWKSRSINTLSGQLAWEAAEY
jgi:hypothetical protein